MPPCQTRNSALAAKTPADTEGDPVTAIKDSPSTSVIMSDDQPALARAFNRLADGLLNTKRTPTFARVQEPNLFNGSDTQKLQPFLTQCFLNFRDRPDGFADDTLFLVRTP